MNVKHGFSTLNRLLGKKNKNGQLSKSTTNLNAGTTALAPAVVDNSSIIPSNRSASSHLEQNRITPLPAAISSTPFEHVFRITVLLPRDQLYVARVGAKTKLEKLLELVCENKQLDPEKYEFRHPVDTSQVFNCELTIGAVGLKEIRLCHKSENYDNFNPDEIIKLRHNIGRDSLSSSELSSRNSKHTIKTASPYSSTNSLNSVDSSGMNTNYRHATANIIQSQQPNKYTKQQKYHHGDAKIKSSSNGNNYNNSNNNNINTIVSSGSESLNSSQAPVVPARKKRIAPRPPSQYSVPVGGEQESEKTNGIAASAITVIQTPTTTTSVVAAVSPLTLSPAETPANMGAAPTKIQNETQQPASPLQYEEIEPRQHDLITPNQNPLTIASTKDFHVSSPNLSHCNELTVLKSAEFHKSDVAVDCNGNTNINNQNSHNNNNNNNNNNSNKNNNNGTITDRNRYGNNENLNEENYINDRVSNQNAENPHASMMNGDTIQKSQPIKEAVNGNNFNHLNGSPPQRVPKMRPVSMNVHHNDGPDIGSSRRLSYHSENTRILEDTVFNGSPQRPQTMIIEPIPRKRITTAKKRAPAPPPRGLPIPTVHPRTIILTNQQQSQQPRKEEEIQKPIVNTESASIEKNEVADHQSKVVEHQVIQRPRQHDYETITLHKDEAVDNQEIYSEVRPIDEIPHIVVSSENEKISDAHTPNSKEIHHEASESIISSGSSNTDIYAVPKKVKADAKRISESSSDDDDNIKVYNLKLGKTIVKPLNECEQIDDCRTAIIKTDENESIKISSLAIGGEISRSDSPGWNYPIPAPPNFADPMDPANIAPTTVASSVKCSNSCANDSLPSVDSLKSQDSENEEINSLDYQSLEPVKGEPAKPITFDLYSDKKHTDIEVTNVQEPITAEPESIIISDIEDGYRGRSSFDKSESKFSRQALLENLDSNNGESNTEKHSICAVASDNRGPIDQIEQEDEQLYTETSKQYETYNNGHDRPSINYIQNADVTKSDVINELSSLLSCNGIDKIIRKTSSSSADSSDVGNIESVKPCTLNNFKIQSYSSGSATCSPSHSDSVSPIIENELQATSQDRIKNVEAETSQQSNGHHDPESDAISPLDHEEKHYKKPPERNGKRPSLTLTSNVAAQVSRSKVPTITRSDSFHSTRYTNGLETSSSALPEDFLKTTTRSTSYVSLLGALKLEQKTYDRIEAGQKSASELSIGESPSLQSLIVMKSILNSRKNSLTTSEVVVAASPSKLNNHTDHTERNKQIPQNIVPLPTTNLTTTSPTPPIDECNSDSSKENSPKNKIISQNTNNIINNDVSDNANVLKSKNSNNNSYGSSNGIKQSGENDVKESKRPEPEPKVWKYQGPPSINLSTWNERPKVQVSIKNDSDYKFGGGGNFRKNTTTSPVNNYSGSTIRKSSGNSTSSVILNSSVSRIAINQESSKSNNGEGYTNDNRSNAGNNEVRPRVPFVRSVEYKKSISVVSQQSPSSQQQQQQASVLSSAGNTMTLGRMPKINRASAPTIVPIVRGFQTTNDTITTNARLSLTEDRLRSDIGINDHDKLRNGSTSVSIERSNSRLSKAQLELLDKGISSSSGVYTTTTPFSQVTLRRTGLKEKILASNEPEIRRPSPPKEDVPIPQSHQHTLKQNCAKLEMKLRTVTTTAVQVPIVPPKPTVSVAQQPLHLSSINFHSELTTAIPPPPPPVIRSVVTKQNSLGTTTNLTAAVGEHDLLLNSIRNFNKNSLKRN